MVRKFLLALLLAASNAQAYTLLSVDRLDFEAYRVRDFRDSYYLLNEHEYWKYGTAVVFNLNLVHTEDFQLYFNNRVYGESTNVQYRRIGWTHEFGSRLGDRVELYYQHNSEHLLERANVDTKFKFSNTYGFRLHFVRP